MIRLRAWHVERSRAARVLERAGFMGKGISTPRAASAGGRVMLRKTPELTKDGPVGQDASPIPSGPGSG